MNQNGDIEEQARTFAKADATPVTAPLVLHYASCYGVPDFSQMPCYADDDYIFVGPFIKKLAYKTPWQWAECGESSISLRWGSICCSRIYIKSNIQRGVSQHTTYPTLFLEKLLNNPSISRLVEQFGLYSRLYRYCLAFQQGLCSIVSGRHTYNRAEARAFSALGSRLINPTAIKGHARFSC